MSKRRKRNTRNPAPARQPVPDTALTIPVWEYPAAADAMARDGQVSPQDALEFLLSQPIRVVTLEGDLVTCYLGDSLGELDLTSADQAGIYADAHERGLMDWDEQLRAHIWT